MCPDELLYLKVPLRRAVVRQELCLPPTTTRDGLHGLLGQVAEGVPDSDAAAGRTVRHAATAGVHGPPAVYW
jgi:hypothetical protein